MKRQRESLGAEWERKVASLRERWAEEREQVAERERQRGE